MSEEYDFAALEEAEAILSGRLESTPEMYRMVKGWYSRNSASVETAKRDDGEPLPF